MIYVVYLLISTSNSLTVGGVKIQKMRGYIEKIIGTTKFKEMEKYIR